MCDEVGEVLQGHHDLLEGLRLRARFKGYDRQDAFLFLCFLGRLGFLGAELMEGHGQWLGLLIGKLLLATGHLSGDVCEEALAAGLPREDGQGNQRRHEHLELPSTGPGDEDTARRLQEVAEVFLQIFAQLPTALAELPKGPHDIRHLVGLALLEGHCCQPSKGLEKRIPEDTEAGAGPSDDGAALHWHL